MGTLQEAGIFMIMWRTPLISTPTQPGYLNVRAAQLHKQ